MGYFLMEGGDVAMTPYYPFHASSMHTFLMAPLHVLKPTTWTQPLARSGAPGNVWILRLAVPLHAYVTSDWLRKAMQLSGASGDF